LAASAHPAMISEAINYSTYLRDVVLAAVTQRIGLVATASTTYNEPYHVARKFASLDHLSGGRAGWNVVTSWSDAEARNFSLDLHPEHADRYARAEEFVDVVTGLWDSWEDDAFLYDKASGVHFDASKLHRLDHHGRHFRVRGPLNISRSPQGHPVIVQAGSSEAGQELAARTAEVIFTAQQSLEGAQAFYRGLKGRLARFGRTPDQLKILPGVFPVVGRSAAEAEEKLEALQDLILPSVGLALLSQHLGGIDLSGYPLDGPLPDNLQEPNGAKSRFQLVTGARGCIPSRRSAGRPCLAAGTARGWKVALAPALVPRQAASRGRVPVQDSTRRADAWPDQWSQRVRRRPSRRW
ncbi:NtaA/DmoA family FMN-dependent monooxygenase, partial [Cupriavidus sp. LEh25]|nr:NtaA/DmoA family FMN-dependent monooxygenase [Cupriavidus sp. LEh25]